MKIHKFFVFVLVINWHTNSRVASMAPVKINLNANLRGVMFTDYLCTITQNLFIFHAVQRTFEHNDGLCVCMPLSFIARYGIGNSFNLGNFLHPKKKKHIYQTQPWFSSQMDIVKWNPIKLSVSRWYIFQMVSNLGQIHK